MFMFKNMYDLNPVSSHWKTSSNDIGLTLALGQNYSEAILNRATSSVSSQISWDNSIVHVIHI